MRKAGGTERGLKQQGTKLWTKSVLRLASLCPVTFSLQFIACSQQAEQKTLDIFNMFASPANAALGKMESLLVNEPNFFAC